MMKRTLLIAAACLGLSGLGIMGTAFAEDETPEPPELSWTFAGPFGHFDRAQLQRGFKVYREVCSACHSLNYLAFRNLSQPGGPEFSESQVLALAAEYKVQDGPNDAGDMFERPARPADHIPAPFPNENAAAAANGGKAPPDLSLMPKARTYERGFPWFVFDIFRQYSEAGADYVVAILNGFEEPPQGFQVPAGGHYNEYFPGHVIAMPKPLSDGQVEYPKDASGKPQAPETVQQYARDVTAFLTWVAEPHLEARKRLGFQVMLFLLGLSILLYFTKKRVWARVGGEVDGHATPPMTHNP